MQEIKSFFTIYICNQKVNIYARYFLYERYFLYARFILDGRFFKLRIWSVYYDYDMLVFFQELGTLVYRVEQRNSADKKQLNDLCFELGISLETLSDLSYQDQVSNDRKTVLNSLLESLLVMLQEVQREIAGFSLSKVAIIDYTPEKLCNDGPGRPKYHISEDVLLYFCNL